MCLCGHQLVLLDSLTTGVQDPSSSPSDSLHTHRGQQSQQPDDDEARAVVRALTLVQGGAEALLGPEATAGGAGGRGALGLSEGDRVYGLLQHSKKLHPALDPALLHLLALDGPRARILVLEGAFQAHHQRWARALVEEADGGLGLEQALAKVQHHFRPLPRMPVGTTHRNLEPGGAALVVLTSWHVRWVCWLVAGSGRRCCGWCRCAMWCWTLGRGGQGSPPLRPSHWECPW